MVQGGNIQAGNGSALPNEHREVWLPAKSGLHTGKEPKEFHKIAVDDPDLENISEFSRSHTGKYWIHQYNHDVRTDLFFCKFLEVILICQMNANCSQSESAGLAHFRTSGEEFGYLADPTHSTGYEPKEFDKITSVDGDTTPINDPNCDDISDLSKITRENTGLFGVSAMSEASVSHVSPGESKDRMHRETVARQREEREGSVISAVKSMSKKSQRNSNRSNSLQTHREFYSDEREISENTLNEELNRLFLVKIQL